MENDSPATQPNHPLDSQTIFAALRDVLAKLYPEESDTRVVVADAGLTAITITFSTRAQTNWHNILAEAVRQNRLDALLAVVRTAYRDNQALLAADDLYRRFLDQGGKLKPPIQLPINGDQASKILEFLAIFEHLLSTSDMIQLIKMVPQPLVPLKNLFAERFTDSFFSETALIDGLQFDHNETEKILLKDTVRFLLQMAWDKGYFMAKFYRHNRIPAPQNAIEGTTVMEYIVDENGQLANLSVLLDVFLQRAISMSTEEQALIRTFEMFPFGQELAQVMSPHIDKWGDKVRSMFGFAALISEAEDELLKQKTSGGTAGT